MTTRARGTKFQLLGKAETTAGTRASGNFDQLPCYSFSVEASQPLVKDPVLSNALGRDPQDPYVDVLTVSGSAEFPLETGSLAGHLTRSFGALVTTGSGPHTDTWTAGGTVPSVTYEKGFTDEGSYHEFDGCKHDTFGIDFAANGTGRLKIGIKGLSAPTAAGASIGGTPVLGTFARLLNKAATLKIAGSAFANIMSGSFTVNNALEEIRTVRGDTTGAALALDDGLLDISGKLTLRYAVDTLLTDALASTAVAIALEFALTGGYVLSFNFPRCFFSRPSIPVTGPAGVEQTVDFMASHDSSAAAAFTVTWTRA